jgi:hypothetical protein
MDCIVKKAIEIQFHPKNFNMYAGFTLSRTWQPMMNIFKQSTQSIESKGQVHQSFDCLLTVSACTPS